MKYELNKEMHLDCETKISAINEEERTVTAVISTSAIDRDREVLLPKGMEFERFKKNPVVPWAHDTSSPPIGKALWIKVKGQKITAKVQFATTEFAEEIWQLFKGGFLKAFSVGFIPLDGRSPTPADLKKNPAWADARFIISKWELLEFSPVPVPANPEALMQAVKCKKLSLSDSTMKLFEIEPEEKELEIKMDADFTDNDKTLEDTVIDVDVKALPEVYVIPNVEVKREIPDVEVMVTEALKKKQGTMY